MGWLDSVNTDSLLSVWNSAANVGSGSSYVTDKTAETVPTNAIGSMTPVTAAVTTSGWESTLQNVLSGVTGYLIKKDATKNGVVAAAPAPAAAASAAQPAASSASRYGGIALIAGVAVAVVVVVKLLK